MEQHKDAGPAMAAVLAAIKATVKGGIGKLRERTQSRKCVVETVTWGPVRE
jgi:hypothetical protein